MKTVLVMLLCVAAIALCAAFGARFFFKRQTPPLPLTAKLPGKAAVVYYSQSKVRNTALLAQWIAKATGGDLVEIEMEEPYPEPYPATLKAAGRDHREGILPAIKPLPSLEAYDVVFIGSPIWYGSYAAPVGTFLKDNDLKGKIVAPFCTHGGGGEGRFLQDIKSACPEAKVLDSLSLRGSNQIERRLGLGVNSHHTENDVTDWLNKLF